MHCCRAQKAVIFSYFLGIFGRTAVLGVNTRADGARMDSEASYDPSLGLLLLLGPSLILIP
jgi:hypothetical protein